MAGQNHSFKEFYQLLFFLVVCLELYFCISLIPDIKPLERVYNISTLLLYTLPKEKRGDNNYNSKLYINICISTIVEILIYIKKIKIKNLEDLLLFLLSSSFFLFCHYL